MIKVLIVHPNCLISETIAAVIREERDIGIIGYAINVTEALSYLPDCDIALVSVELPEDGALELARAVGSQELDCRVLIVGTFDSEAAFLKYVEAGAVGHIDGKESPEAAVQKIRAAFNDNALISPQLTALLIARLIELAEPGLNRSSSGYPHFELIPAEWAGPEFTAQGWNNRRVVEELITEIGTVKDHMHNILKKLNVNSRKDVIKYLESIKNIQQ